MSQDVNRRRRWFGAGCIVGAVALLVLGETVFKERLHGAGFVLYWLACVVLTALAMLVALADAGAQLARTRSEHRELIEHTIQEIQEDAESRSRRRKR
jgi:hypothetical protein